jgi:protein-S-isoprenylcysteine O-methyltransferase Ste14
MMIYLGAVVAADTWWPFLLLPPLVVAIQQGVVRREERYLEANFGQEYRDYKARVPRWL